MKYSTIWISLLVIGGMTAGGVAFFRGKASQNPDSTQPMKQKPAPMVQAISATRSQISQTLELTGSVEPYRVARLASPAEGPVVDLGVRESDQVSSGDQLLTIGRKSGVDALILSLQAELKKEKDNLDRTRQLVESRALPAEQLDQARATYERVHASLIKSEETAGDYTITAPWPGVVSSVKVKEGEFVAPRAILIEIYDPSSLLVRAAIPEKHAAVVIEGMHVTARLDAYTDRVFRGRIGRVYPYLDSRLRTRTVEIVLEDGPELLPGMFARLSISLKAVDDVVVVPEAALVHTPKGEVIFVVENGKVASRAVETGLEAEGRVEIISGLQPGEKVVIAGNDKLQNGVSVRLAGDQPPGGRKADGKAGSSSRQSGKGGDGQ